MEHPSSTPLRILLLCEGDAETNDSWSGISRSVVNQLRARGHEVIPADVDLYGIERLLTAARQYSPERRRWWIRYHLMEAPFARRSGKALRHLQATSPRPDVVLQFGATFRVDSADVPVVLYCDGNVALSELAISGGQSEASFLTPREIAGVREREARVYREAAAVLTISERLRRSFCEDFSLPPERVRTIYAGSNFEPERIPVPTLALKDGPPTVLFVGRQFQRKGGDVLLQAFARVTERFPDARLLIAGPSDLSVDQKGVHVLGLLNKDTPQGWEALKNAYVQSHVFCMPTRYEGLSISFLEAMYFGLPCISTFNEWSQPEMILDGITGLVVPVDQPEALADSICSLFSDPGRARAMGLKGRRRAEDTFTWDTVIGKMEGVLHGVASVVSPKSYCHDQPCR